MVAENEETSKRIELPELIITRRSDGIIHVYIKENTRITRELQDRMIESYWKVTDKRCPFIFEAGAFVSITKKGRENAILIEEKSPVDGTALIASNLGQKILTDYYYKINKPKRPLKVFRTKDEAITWLKTLPSFG